MLLASHKVGINEVETALKVWNVNLPTGQITGPQRSFTLQTSGQLTTADQYKSLVVAYRNGDAGPAAGTGRAEGQRRGR